MEERLKYAKAAFLVTMYPLLLPLIRAVGGTFVKSGAVAMDSFGELIRRKYLMAKDSSCSIELFVLYTSCSEMRMKSHGEKEPATYVWRCKCGRGGPTVG